MEPHKRHVDFPIGRICMICGRGASPRLSGCYGAAAALIALGYVWDRSKSLGYAHNACIIRQRKKMEKGKS